MAWRASAPLPDIVRQAAAVGRSDVSGSAGAYARIMAGVATGTFIAPEVSTIMAEHLSWPMEIGDNRERFAAFGAKGGSLPGVLTNAMYLTPREGDFAGETRVVVLLMHQVPPRAFVNLMGSFAHQDLMIAAATSRDGLEAAREAVAGGV